MGPPDRGGGGDGIDKRSAKHLLDSIGKKVHDEIVKKGVAETYIEALKGKLQAAKGMGETTGFSDPCKLVEDYRSKANGDVKRYPCANRQTVRFSDEYGGQCTFNRIKDNETNDNACGACAPFRRLHLCDYNLEKMGRTSTTKHDLLAEVCMAAKYEGETLTRQHYKHKLTNPDTTSQICTVLARSFADIGDIVRGKDLYLGYDDKEKKRREKLENNLKDIFAKIYDNLKEEAKKHYKDTTKNYYQLREDWWTANRETVWKAITCGTHDGDTYFRATCDIDRGFSQATKQCRCDKDKGAKDGDQVPTYFDYVPQYLRWFEEWAEDFCRKRKHKLENAIKICRYDENNERKYCSGNGYNCKKTIRAENKLVEGDDCHKCSVSCKPFVKWIDNQKKEFEKQKKKYDKEIKKKHDETTVTIKNANGDTTINNWYVKEFYEKLKESEYGKVDDFLKLLSKEGICQKEPKVEDEKASPVDFTKDETNGTFCRTKYCEPCPWCGLQRENPPWQAIEEKLCRSKEIRNFDDNESTEIELLDKNTSGTSIVEKLGGLCNDPSEPTIQTWKCRFESSEKHYCVLQDDNKDKPQERTIHSFNSLFWHWVTEMLEDSIKWRKEHDKCINNKNTCKKGCKKPCDCFEKWVKRMKKEWEQVLELYDKQPDFNGALPYVTFEYLLKEDYFPKIKAPYEEVKFVEEIKKIIDENSKNISNCTKENNSINTFLGQEEKEAQNCVTNDPEKNCKKKTPKPQPPAGGAGGRSGQPRSPADPTVEPATGSDVQPAGRIDTGTSPGSPPRSEEGDADNLDNGSEDEEEEEEEEDTNEDSAGSQEDTGRGEEAPAPKEAEVAPTTDTTEKVCKIVDDLFSNPKQFSDACKLKYGKTAPTSWKCVPTTSGSDEKSGDKGGLCIPPRRRRLYTQKLHDWANSSGSNTQVSGQAQPQSQGGTSSQIDGKTASQDPSDKLRTAFIESAAVETFFLWHRYKEENKTQNTSQLPLLANGGTLDGDDDNNPQTQLKSGTIPTDFLRQMFYTLGDYRDICVGEKTMIKALEASGDKNIDKIEDKIKSVIEKSGDTPPTPGKPSENPRKKWWDQNVESIWNGMICALTYTEKSVSGEKNTTITQDTNLKTALWDDTKNKPKTKTDGTNGKDYTYENVELKDNDENGGTRTTGDTSSPSGSNDPLNNPTLKNFVLRPPYFRYLEEWGQNFCTERKKRLEQIKVECKVEHDEYKCSGDGESCDYIRKQDYTILPSFNCPSCATPCGLYKRWIGRKKIEFGEQDKIYEQQKKDAEGNMDAESKPHSISDQNFVKKLGTDYTSIKLFLQKLGPCSKNDTEEDNKKLFEDTNVTFKHTNLCDPCPITGVKCKKGHCDKAANGKECPRGKITAEDIKNKTDPNGNIEMVVSDKSANGFGDLEEACQYAGIFKGIRKDVWKCTYFCNSDVCGLKKKDGNIDDKQIILIRALARRWVENFLEDYNKIKKKLKSCINNGEKSICIKDCVGKWIEAKTKEWETIRDRYFEQYKGAESDMKSLVKNFLEGLQSQIDFNKAIKPCSDLRAFEDSCGLNSDKPSENGHKDAIECMLNKLQEKTKTCQSKHSVQNPENQCKEPPPEDDYEDENEKKVGHPKICGDVIPKEEVKEEGDCDKAVTPDSDTGGNGENEDSRSEEEEEVSGSGDQDSTPAPAPRPEPPKEQETSPPSPTLSDQPTNSISDILSSTIPFGIAIALTSIVFLFLKKKTKSTIDLFRVINIPKGDYDIPTKLSPNRYIPYTSGKYRGKRYIYLEGDSGTDSGYTDHYSDITSSSESEYEELDINDIYVPGSPKYKTLIEVVLEPSGNNTTASDTQNDIPTSDTPPPITDDEWNTLKDEFISQYLQSEQPKDVPNDYTSGNSSTNTNITTMSRDNMEEKPFIMFIQDRNLYSGEEYNYDMSTNSGNNNLYSGENNVYGGIDPTSDNRGLTSGKHDSYSGIDLINDSLSGDYDIYDEILKRKENELFGTNHVKHTTINRVAKPARDDPLHNQLELFHKWLDRHRDMCEKWENHHERLAKLKEQWENETHSGNKNSNIPSNIPNSDIHPSDIPSGKQSDIPSDNNIHSDIPYVLNTDVSIQIHMDNPKPINQFTNMDTILEDLDKYNEPYYDMYDDDIYYDVNDHDTSTVDSNNMDVPSKVQIEMDVNSKLVKEKYPIADVWDI